MKVIHLIILHACCRPAGHMISCLHELTCMKCEQELSCCLKNNRKFSSVGKTWTSWRKHTEVKGQCCFVISSVCVFRNTIKLSGTKERDSPPAVRPVCLTLSHIQTQTVSSLQSNPATNKNCSQSVITILHRQELCCC